MCFKEVQNSHHYAMAPSASWFVSEAEAEKGILDPAVSVSDIYCSLLI